MAQRAFILVFLLVAGFSCRPDAQSQTTAANADTTGYYQFRDGSRDGIGKYYQGREIAEVMGHLGADWLERPERQQEERTDLLASILALKPTDVLADIGAGTGYFSFRLAREVPQGKVLAVDIQPEMIQYLNDNRKKNKAANVEPVLGIITDPRLPPASVDVALLVDAYHEFSNPREMLNAIVTSLKPGGRVVLVEYRAEDPDVPIKELHKLSIAQASREMKAVGLKLLKSDERLPQQHVMIFGR